MPLKAVIQRPARPAPFTLLFCLLIFLVTPASAQERPGGSSGPDAPEASVGSAASEPAPADLNGAPTHANTTAEVAAEPATAEPTTAKPAPVEPAPASAAPLTAEAPAAQPATAATAPQTLGQKSDSNSLIKPIPPQCGRTITAKVVAFDQVYTYNRFGAFNPAG